MGNIKNKDCVAYKNKLAYTREYNKQHTKKRIVIFTDKSEIDVAILNYIEEKRPFSSYVKSLILKDMKENK